MSNSARSPQTNTAEHTPAGLPSPPPRHRVRRQTPASDPDPVVAAPQPQRLEGYGRYDDDPNHVGCPRAATDTTPCVARDGLASCGDDELCIGCTRHPAELLTELVRAVTSTILLANTTTLTDAELR